MTKDVHRIAQYLRGLDRRIQTLEDEREPPGRVDLIRTVKDRGGAIVDVTATVNQDRDRYFYWNDPTAPNWDIGLWDAPSADRGSVTPVAVSPHVASETPISDAPTVVTVSPLQATEIATATESGSFTVIGSTSVIESITATTMVDSFEHNNLTGNYVNDTGAFNITSSPSNGPTDGSYALERDGDLDAGGYRTVYVGGSPADLDTSTYPNAGDDFVFDVMTTDATATQATLMFFHNGDKSASAVDESYYETFLKFNDGQIVLRVIDSTGSASQLDVATGISYSSNETYTVEHLTPTDPTVDPIEVNVYDSARNLVGSVSGTDTATSGFTSGDFAWRGYVNSTGIQTTYDNFHHI